ncbi:MAG: hypothetical protein ACTSR3_03635 [Candidatus Helarchaeota archaeon]
MQILQNLEEILGLLVIFLTQNYYYPPGTLPMTPEIIFLIIFVLIGLIPVSLPLIYYAFRLQSFVKYSDMWKPWKSLAFGWLSMVIGEVAGVSMFLFIFLSGLIYQSYVPITFLILILSPLIVFVLITIILTFQGIRKFYHNSKEAVESVAS